MITVVVAPEPGANVIKSTALHEVASSARNGVSWVEHIAALAYLRPGGGQKLHRPKRASRAHTVDATHHGFDQIDTGENLPLDAGLFGTALVVTHQDVQRFGVDDAPSRNSFAHDTAGMEQSELGARLEM